MELHIDVPWILQVAETAGAGDPAPDDYGVPVSAVARHRAELFEQPVYGGPYARAAALVHTALGRCRWLERSATWPSRPPPASCTWKPPASRSKPTRDDAIALKDLLLDPACTAKQIAALWESWPTTS